MLVVVSGFGADVLVVVLVVVSGFGADVLVVVLVVVSGFGAENNEKKEDKNDERLSNTRRRVSADVSL